MNSHGPFAADCLEAEAKIERQSTVCKFSRARSESSLFSGIDKRRFDTELCSTSVNCQLQS
eukprot:scaffold12487_cov37-Cyclotella_meneghiniana.AAC.4